MILSSRPFVQFGGNCSSFRCAWEKTFVHVIIVFVCLHFQRWIFERVCTQTFEDSLLWHTRIWYVQYNNFIMSVLGNKCYYSYQRFDIQTRRKVLSSTTSMRHHSVKMLWTPEAQPSEFTTNFDFDNKFMTTLMTHIVVDNSTDNAKPHSICFLPQHQRQRKRFFRARAEKGIAWHIGAISVIWTLIDKGKLAN